MYKKKNLWKSRQEGNTGRKVSKYLNTSERQGKEIIKTKCMSEK